jgi:hypothetical protein
MVEEYTKKLDEKIKELNSTRVFKKITPKGDLSWYVKWVASFFILTAVAARSVGTIPLADLWLSLIGTLGWFWVGMLWHDRALTMLNGALATVLGMGLLNYYFGA